MKLHKNLPEIGPQFGGPWSKTSIGLYESPIRIIATTVPRSGAGGATGRKQFHDFKEAIWKIIRPIF